MVWLSSGYLLVSAPKWRSRSMAQLNMQLHVIVQKINGARNTMRKELGNNSILNVYYVANVSKPQKVKTPHRGRSPDQTQKPILQSFT